MATFSKRAVDLLREVASCTAENLPPYNDDAVALVCEQAQEHGSMLYAALNGREQQPQPEASDSDGEAAAPGPGSWENHPELAAAVVVHHETILRLKRILLAYTRERRNRVKQLRWQQRSLPDCVVPNLSLAEKEWFQKYDQLLSGYMRTVGLDLTLATPQEQAPPRESSVLVRVLRDAGDVVLSTGTVALLKGTVHLVPAVEADPLLRAGVLSATPHSEAEAKTL